MPLKVLSALKVCRNLQKGKKLHVEAIEAGIEGDIDIASTLIDMYVKCGSIADARNIFEGMPQRNVLSWNVMIQGYAQNGESEMALDLYERMKSTADCTANARTFVGALMACTSLASVRDEDKNLYLEKVKALHSEATKCGQDSKNSVESTLFNTYAKFGSMVDAYKIFERMSQRSAVSWATMIMGYAQNGDNKMAFELFTRMVSENCTTPDRGTLRAALEACLKLAAEEKGEQIDGKLVKIGCLQKGKAIHSQITKCRYDREIDMGNAMIEIYVKCGSMVEARNVFNNMLHKDVETWTSLIMGYAQHGEPELALQFFQRMGCAPNARTFVAVLTAMSSLAGEEEGIDVNGQIVKTGCLEEGKDIHSQAAKNGFDTQSEVAAALIDMYVKCGSMKNAAKVQSIRGEK